MSRTESENIKLAAVLALLILAVVIVGSAVVSRPKSNASSSQGTVVSENTGSSTSADSKDSSAANYKDGTYTATGEYDSPGGVEGLKVSLTLSDNIVTSVNAVSETNDPTAASYQSMFISGYKPLVVGKKINTIELSNVSGSSLTSQGFNDALEQIEKQAQT